MGLLYGSIFHDEDDKDAKLELGNALITAKSINSLNLVVSFL